MRKLLFFSLLISTIANNAIAQQDPHFSQFMLVKSYWSSALTAVDKKSSVKLISRSQWVGYEPTDGSVGGSPSTQFLTFSAPVTFKKMPLGIGVNVIYDKLGVMSNLEAQISISYHKVLDRGTFSFGIRQGIINQTLDFTELRTVLPEPSYPLTKESKLAFDLGLGLAYSTNAYTIAFGVNHLFRPVFDYGFESAPEANEGLSIVHNLYTEYNYALTYNVDLTPSLLVKTDFNSYSVDAGMVAIYNKKLWIGLTYRHAESMVVLFGYPFLEGNKLKAGYSFDYVIKNQSAKQATSHEIYISYDLPSIATGAKKIIRTPRFRY